MGLTSVAVSSGVLAATTGERAATQRGPGSSAVDRDVRPRPTTQARPVQPSRPDSRPSALGRDADGSRPVAAGLLTDVPEQGSGRFIVAPGTSVPVGRGTLITYTVEVEEDLALDAAEVASEIGAVLADSRGWTSVMARTLQRVSTDPVIRIRIAAPETTDALCSPLDTGGRLSCRNGQYVVLNAWRWMNGADAYDGDLLGYRRYMINHEVGHALGNAHVGCPAPGAVAPVMLQQTKGLDGCRPNPWPTAE